MSGNEHTDDVPADLQALFEAEKERPAPGAGDREAVYTAVAASCGFAAVAAGVSAVGGAAAATTGGTTIGASTGAAAGVSTAGSSLPALLVKPVTLLVFAAGAATGTGTTMLVNHVTSDPEPRPAEVRVVNRQARSSPAAPEAKPVPAAAPPVAALTPTPVAEPKRAPATEPAPAPVVKRAPRRPKVPLRTPGTAPANTSVVERNLLERARTALSRGEAAAALRALQTHKRRYPRGTLAEERAALMAVALADLGKFKRARAAARAFKKRHPQSLLLPLVNDALKRASAQ